jgi:hypothetical protein
MAGAQVAAEEMKAWQKEVQAQQAEKLRPELEKLFLDFDENRNGVLEPDESEDLIKQ